MFNNTFKKYAPVLLNLSILNICKSVKFNFILGSTAMFFSATNIVGPMVGVIGGLGYAVNFLIFQVLYKLLTFMVFGGSIAIGYHIPQFFASYYWLSDSKLKRVILPLLCMGLFAIHPTGLQAFAYAMLWLIPIIISFVGFNNIFLRALGSTFVAHAIGSVLWLYTVPMQPIQWITLIPVAVTERLLFAAGMVVVYYIVNFAKNYFKGKVFSFKKLPF